MNQNAYYLARDGKNSGPFTKDEIESMRGKGELRSFHWMWDPSMGNWMPLSAPPSPPGAAETQRDESPTPTPSPTPEAAQPQKRVAVRKAVERTIEAVCHDNRSLVSGTIEALTEYGCELLVEDHEAGPVFSKRIPLRLNLLDPNTGESTDISAQLEGVSRRDGRWAYRLRWESCPELLAG